MNEKNGLSCYMCVVLKFTGKISNFVLLKCLVVYYFAYIITYNLLLTLLLDVMLLDTQHSKFQLLLITCVLSLFSIH